MIKKFSPIFLLLGIVSLVAVSLSQSAHAALPENSFGCAWLDGNCILGEANCNGDEGFYSRGQMCNLITSGEEGCVSAYFECRVSGYHEGPIDRGGEEIPIGLSEKVGNLYTWAVSLAGLVALSLIIYGGVVWAASAGNPSRITEAKAWITHALLGLFMLLGAYLILGFINPDLTKLDEVFLAQNVNPQSQVIELGPGAGIGGSGDGGDGDDGDGDNVVYDSICPVGENYNPGGSWCAGSFYDCRTCRNSSGDSVGCTAGSNSMGGPYPQCSGATCNRPHLGVDIAGPTGTRLVAVEDGVVSRRISTQGGGRIIVLYGASGTEYQYMHLSGWEAEDGESVVKGQVIAYMGGSGGSSGVDDDAYAPHLHFEALGGPWNGEGTNHYDPCSFLQTECGGLNCRQQGTPVPGF